MGCHGPFGYLSSFLIIVLPVICDRAQLHSDYTLRLQTAYSTSSVPALSHHRQRQQR